MILPENAVHYLTHVAKELKQFWLVKWEQPPYNLDYVPPTFDIINGLFLRKQFVQ